MLLRSLLGSSASSLANASGPLDSCVTPHESQLRCSIDQSELQRPPIDDDLQCANAKTMMQSQCNDLKQLHTELAAVLASHAHTDVLEIISRLESYPMTICILRETGIGRTMNSKRLRNCNDAEVAARSRQLVARWRRLCHSYRNSDTAPVESSNKSTKRSRAEAFCEAVVAAAWAPQDASATDPSSARRAYLARMRTVSSVLRRQEGASLREQCLDGRLTPERLLSLSPEELLPPDKKALREAEREASLRMAVLGRGSMFTCFSEHLECPSCGAQGARYSTPGSEE